MPRKPAKKRVVADELCLTDSTGVVRALIALDSEGSPMLQFCDSDGRPRLDLMLDTDGDPYIMLWSKNQLLFSIGVSSREKGSSLTMWAENGRGYRQFIVDREGSREEHYSARKPATAARGRRASKTVAARRRARK